MSIDAMKQALVVLEEIADEVFAPYDNKLGDAILALRAAIKEAQGLAEKVPARGTLLEQTLGKVWDEMPHTALMDAIIGGTGVMLGDKRIDPASIYKQPEQEPRQWQGLTDEELNQIYAEPQTHAGQYARAIEAKLKEKNYVETNT